MDGMIRNDTGWSFWKPWGHYSCYEEGLRTITFDPDTSEEEITAFITAEAQKHRQGFGVETTRSTEGCCVVNIKITCDSSD